MFVRKRTAYLFNKGSSSGSTHGASLLGERAQAAQRPVLGDPDRAG